MRQLESNRRRRTVQISISDCYAGGPLRIALLEDDPDQSALIRLWLEDAEHSVSVHDNGGDFLRAIRRESFDLYLLDWLLPDLDGLDVLRKLRTELQDRTPVLVATVKKEERDIVRALESGADDYLVKPVRQRELIARADAIFRRSGGVGTEVDIYDAPPYTMDLHSKQASLHGQKISLTQREFDLAMFFFRNAGRAVSRAHLLEAIWGIENTNVTTRTIDTHISRLRKKMRLHEDNGWKLTAIYQHGYRLEQIGKSTKQ